MLRTLGDLRLEGSDFTRPQPLLLLAYLSLEGPKERRFLAELFWMNAADPLNRLSTALSRLRKVDAGLVHANDLRVWTEVGSDVQELRTLLRDERHAEALERYAGSFLEGFDLATAGSVELEEWVYETRESLADQMQQALLGLAETSAIKQDFMQATALAERAYRLPGVAGHDAPTLKRLYPLLRLADSPLSATASKEAEGY